MTDSKEMNRNLAIIVLFALGAHMSSAETICRETEEHLVITRNGQHVLTYQKKAKVPEGVEEKYARSGFIHPISTPSGRVVTDDYPVPHHSHQNGVFFAWRKASFKGKELNFWEPSEAKVKHVKVLDVFNNPGHAGFRVVRSHTDGAEQILREVWTVTVSEPNGHIDITSAQDCVANSPLKLEKFHYGGMAIRGSRQWFPGAKGFVENCKMLTSEGKTQANGNHTRPKWVSIGGLVDKAPVAITFIPRPSNFRYPQHVRLHPKMPYFCFIPTVEEPFEIKPGTAWISQYRIVVQDGEPDADKLNALQKEYAGEK